MKKQPLFLLAIFFILGILFQEKFLLDDFSVKILIVVAVSLCISTFSKNMFLLRFRGVIFAVFFFALGVILHSYNSISEKIHDLPKKENIVFKLQKKLNSNVKNKRYEVIAWKDSTTFTTVLTVPKEKDELDFSHYYKVAAYINKAQPPKNDYQFDYATYLKRKDIFFQSYVAENIEIAKRNDLSFSEKIKQKRLEVLQKINESNLSPKSREFMKGIILADRTEMDSQTVSDFSKTGLVHILSISGSHIVVIFAVFFVIFKNIIPSKFRKFAIIMSLAFIWVFAIFIDFGNPVVRSCIMITCYYSYIMLQRKADMLHSTALAALIILFINTQEIFDVGFQLSFMAVLGIYWLNQPILKRLPKTKNNYQFFWASIISITLSAQIATLPLVLYYFHQFSLISFVANLVIIPISQIVIISSMLLTILIAVGIDFDFLNKIYDVFIQYVLQLIHWFSGFESLFAKNIAFSVWEVALLTVATYFLRFLILNFNVKKLLPVAYSLTAFFVIKMALNYYFDSKDEVMVHHHFKEKYFSAKEAGKVTFWISENADREKIQQYIIDPYLTSRRTKNVEVKTFPHGTKTIFYKDKEYLLQEE